jgi:hypothetical protein
MTQTLLAHREFLHGLSEMSPRQPTARPASPRRGSDKPLALGNSEALLVQSHVVIVIATSKAELAQGRRISSAMAIVRASSAADITPEHTRIAHGATLWSDHRTQVQNRRPPWENRVHPKFGETASMCRERRPYLLVDLARGGESPDLEGHDMTNARAFMIAFEHPNASRPGRGPGAQPSPHRSFDSPTEQRKYI